MTPSQRSWSDDLRKLDRSSLLLTCTDTSAAGCWREYKCRKMMQYDLSLICPLSMQWCLTSKQAEGVGIIDDWFDSIIDLHGEIQTLNMNTPSSTSHSLQCGLFSSAFRLPFVSFLRSLSLLACWAILLSGYSRRGLWLKRELTAPPQNPR